MAIYEYDGKVKFCNYFDIEKVKKGINVNVEELEQF